MTKKIVWRLSKLPTVDEISQLVTNSVLTKEEAREILLKEETEEDRDKASLEAEIKFLKNLVEKLSTRSQIIETIREVKVPYYKERWYEPYKVWCSSGDLTTYAANTGIKSANYTLTSSTGNSTNALIGSNESFSSIKTF